LFSIVTRFQLSEQVRHGLWEHGETLMQWQTHQPLRQAIAAPAPGDLGLTGHALTPSGRSHLSYQVGERSIVQSIPPTPGEEAPTPARFERPLKAKPGVAARRNVRKLSTLQLRALSRCLGRIQSRSQELAHETAVANAEKALAKELLFRSRRPCSEPRRPPLPGAFQRGRGSAEEASIVLTDFAATARPVAPTPLRPVYGWGVAGDRMMQDTLPSSRWMDPVTGMFHERFTSTRSYSRPGVDLGSDHVPYEEEEGEEEEERTRGETERDYLWRRCQVDPICAPFISEVRQGQRKWDHGVRLQAWQKQERLQRLEPEALAACALPGPAAHALTAREPTPPIQPLRSMRHPPPPCLELLQVLEVQELDLVQEFRCRGPCMYVIVLLAS